MQERRRLKERFPTLAMETSDKQQCTVALSSYEQLLSNNDICEGNCTRGRHCPTGVATLNFARAALLGPLLIRFDINQLILSCPNTSASMLSTFVANIAKPQIHTIMITLSIHIQC